METIMDPPTRGPVPKLTWDCRLIQGVLINSELLRGCAPAQAAAVAAQCWAMEAKRGETIVTRGKTLPGIFAVAYGTVKLALRQTSGAERVIRLVQPGQTFCEASALLGRAAPLEAVALTPCKLVVVPSATVYALIERDPRMARLVVRTLGQRVIGLLTELESSCMQSGAQRLGSYLAGLAKADEGNDACVIRLPAPKAVIAARLDMKKETFSRLLRSLSSRGLIVVNGGAITLLDRAKLSAVS
jgi:CRP-like cAMP-binding protein